MTDGQMDGQADNYEKSNLYAMHSQTVEGRGDITSVSRNYTG